MSRLPVVTLVFLPIFLLFLMGGFNLEGNVPGSTSAETGHAGDAALCSQEEYEEEVGVLRAVDFQLLARVAPPVGPLLNVVRRTGRASAGQGAGDVRAERLKTRWAISEADENVVLGHC